MTFLEQFEAEICVGTMIGVNYNTQPINNACSTDVKLEDIEDAIFEAKTGFKKIRPFEDRVYPFDMEIRFPDISRFCLP
jgi:hypothetical protein